MKGILCIITTSRKQKCYLAQQKRSKNSVNVSNGKKYSAEWVLMPPYNRERSDNALVRLPIFTENDKDGETVDDIVEDEMLVLA